MRTACTLPAFQGTQNIPGRDLRGHTHTGSCYFNPPVLFMLHLTVPVQMRPEKCIKTICLINTWRAKIKIFTALAGFLDLLVVVIVCCEARSLLYENVAIFRLHITRNRYNSPNRYQIERPFYSSTFWVDLSWNHSRLCRGSLCICFINAVHPPIWALYSVHLTLDIDAKWARRPNLNVTRKFWS